MVASRYFAEPIDIATVVVPVAVYFLVLGLLNSRRRPQLLTGRMDFAVLVTALSPLVALPVLNSLGASVWTVPMVVAAPALLILLLAPGGRMWVVYNASRAQAASAVERALDRVGLAHREAPEGFYLPDSDATVRLGTFSLLRNVTIRLKGGGRELSRAFSDALGEELSGIRAEPSPAGVSLLLAATGMLLVPLTLLARDVPEIVRLLTDLL